MTVGAKILLYVVASLSFAACSTERASRDSTSPVVPGQPAANGTKAPVDPPPEPGQCPLGLQGPALVRLATRAGVPYCIDQTEVTQGQFSVFVAALGKEPGKLHPNGEPEQCRLAEYKLLPDAPEADGEISFECSASRYDPVKQADVPMVCVHPCAARAFCQWAGKELCGRVEGGPLAAGEATNPDASAWHNACTNGGESESASPGAVASGVCDPPVADASVDARPGCVGTHPPFDQVVNIGGNVREWADATDGGVVHIRGPRRISAEGPVNDSCSEAPGGGYAGVSEGIGFRCCKPLGR